MRDYVEIGPSPCEEDCVQVGSDDYYEKARMECTYFIYLIRKVLGPEPEGARLVIKSNHHHFGNYLEVVCYFDNNNEAAMKYAYNCEENAPMKWEYTTTDGVHIGIPWGITRRQLKEQGIL